MPTKNIEPHDKKNTKTPSIFSKVKILAYILYLFLSITFIYTLSYFYLLSSRIPTKPLLTSETISTKQINLKKATLSQQVINVVNTQIITDDNQFDYIFEISNHTPQQFTGKIIITLFFGNVGLMQQTFDYTQEPIPAYQSRTFITVSDIPPKNYSFYPVIDTYNYTLERKNHQLVSGSGNISKKIVKTKSLIRREFYGPLVRYFI